MRSKRKTGPSRQTKAGPNWQCPHSPIAHFMLRSIETKIRSIARPRWRSASIGKPHHDLRPANHCHCMVRINRHTRKQRRHDTDITAPIGCGMVDRDGDVDIEAPPPCLQLSPVKDFGRTSRAIEHGDPAVMLPMGEHAIDHRPQRREPEPTCHDDDVAAFALGDGPARAIGSPHTYDLIVPEPGDCATDGPDCPHRVHDPALFGRISTEADRHFAQPEHVEHVELARGKGEGREQESARWLPHRPFHAGLD